MPRSTRERRPATVLRRSSLRAARGTPTSCVEGAAIENVSDGCTALAWAAILGHLDRVRVLLSAGANVASCFGLPSIKTPATGAVVTIAGAANDAAGIAPTLIASLPVAARPPASVAAVWAGAAPQ
jgi:hypothetical protein